MLNRVLLVDDSKSARFALRKLLEKSGLEVDVAENAEEALGYLGDNHPDVIFMDHFMPGMDGFQATQQIKQMPERSGIPVIMCTSKEDPDYVEQARSHGALDILPKPATSEALNSLLSKLGDAEEASNESMPEKVSASVVEPVTAAVAEPQAEAKPEIPAIEVDALIAERVSEQLNQRLPELREAVLSEFDKIAKSILDGYMQQAISSVKHEFLANVEEESRKVADQTVSTKVESLVAGQVGQIQETLKRDVNGQLADIYSALGELKASQQLKTISPELNNEITRNVREVAAEATESALARARQTAEEVTAKLADQRMTEAVSKLNEQTEVTVSKALEGGVSSARKSAEEIAWKEIADFQNRHNGAFGKLYAIAGVALVASLAALGGGAYLLLM